MKSVRIVAEVSKKWPEVEPGTLAQRFEKVIQFNEQRGYVLESWHLDRLMCYATPNETPHLNETIIAVFRRGDINANE